MRIGLNQVSADTVSWLADACGRAGCTRASLARGLCEREGWHDHRGGPRLELGHRALPVVAREAGAVLPPRRARRARVGDSHARPAAGYPDTAVSCGLEELGEVALDPVTEANRRDWESMMESHHPQGWRRAPGGQLRYWIRCATHGTLGGIGFTSAGFQLGPRDRAIGWSGDARHARIGRVVHNQRLLILPSVRVRGLASTVLRQAAARVAGDWEESHGVRPVLLQTFTSPDQSGTGYRAAGWEPCPEPTSGRR